MTTLLNYDIRDPKVGSTHEEWLPHAGQDHRSIEWWYMTSVLHDASGHTYFLVWCIFNFTGSAYHQMPGLTVPPGQRVATVLGGLTDYDRKQRFEVRPMAIVSGEDMWDDAANALRLDIPECRCRWRYEGDTMMLSIDTPKLTARLRMDGAEQVMWAKDKLDIEGFIQEGGEDDRSFYYSLPRLKLSGLIEFDGLNGQRRSIEVQGPAWVDRQWGDFLTKSWEWTSLRFDNGARVNLYNFANGHQVATYQTADGSTSWLPGFKVEQNGYVKSPANGVWMSWGWTYEFDRDIEQGRRFRLEPLSRGDVFVSKMNTLFEGAARIVDEATGEQVGMAVSESMDVRVMENFPYGPRQK